MQDPPQGPLLGGPEHPLLVPISPRGFPLPLRAPREERDWVRPGPQPTHQLLTSQGGCDPACSRSRGHPRRTTGCNSCGEQRDGLGGPAAREHHPRGASCPGCPQGAPGQEQEHAAPSPGTHSPGLAARVEPGAQPPAAPGLQGTWRPGGKRIPGARAPRSAHPGWPRGLFSSFLTELPPQGYMPLVPSMPLPGCGQSPRAGCWHGEGWLVFWGIGGPGHTATPPVLERGSAAHGHPRGGRAALSTSGKEGRKSPLPRSGCSFSQRSCWPASPSPPKWPGAPGWPWQQSDCLWGTTTQHQPAGPSRGSGTVVPNT